MARLSLTLLGGFRAQLGSGPPVALTSKKAQALLAYLSVRPGVRHTRDGVGALLWSNTDDGQARQSLRQALVAVRRALLRVKPPLLETSNETIALNDAGMDIDVRRFEQLAGSGDTKALTRALSLFGGDLLEGFRLREPRFDDWLHGERERLRGHAARALERICAQSVTGEALEGAIGAALRLLALDPLHESVHRSLMRLYLRSGRRAAALRQYQVCVDVLQRELDVAPEPATKALYQEALTHDSPGPVAIATVEPALPDTGRFIGRQRELGRLQQAFEAARGGRGRVITILGEAGIGKTRLLQELSARIASRGGRVIVGRCFESEQVLPFAPWIDMLRGEGARMAVGEVAGAYPRHRAQLARLLPELGGERSAAPEPAEDSRRIFEAVAQVVTTLAARRPVAIVLDDLHWADDMSVRLLAFLARRREAGRLLLIASAREDELHDRPLLRRILAEIEAGADAALSMDPLSETETLTLARQLASGPSRPDAERVAKRVWRLSEGNPFMVVETVRSLRDGAASNAADRLPLSQRIHQMVLRRLERLGRRSQTLIAVAAVIGREFDYALLPSAAGMSERTAAEGVEELVRHRVLHTEGERLAFAHDYIREVAYARLLPPRRRLLHGAVARAMETRYANDLVPHAAALGRHYREAGLHAAAVVHLRLAAAVASGRGAHWDAVAHLEQALAALAGLPQQRATAEQAIDVRFELSNCFSALGEFSRQGEWASAAARAAETLGDEGRLAWASSYMSYYYWVMGRFREACAHAGRALATAEARGDVPLMVNARKSLGLALELSGYPTQAGAHFARCTELLTGELARHPCGLQILPAITCRAWLALTLADRGQFDRAVALGREALRLADELDHSSSGSIAYWCVGRVYHAKGDDARATPLFQRSLELAQEGNFKIMMPLVAVSLGLQHANAGRALDGLAQLEGGLHVFEPGNALHPYAMQNLGLVYWRAGRRDDARSAWTEALTLARQTEQRGTEGAVLFLLGSLAAEGDAAERAAAVQYLRQALEIGEELEMRLLQARCHLGLGKLLEDERHLATGIAMFSEMGVEAGAGALSPDAGAPVLPARE
jgi:DNA-binding SARP family transcriptional activator